MVWEGRGTGGIGNSEDKIQPLSKNFLILGMFLESCICSNKSPSTLYYAINHQNWLSTNDMFFAVQKASTDSAS